MLHICNQVTSQSIYLLERMDCHSQLPMPASDPQQLPADKGRAIPNSLLEFVPFSYGLAICAKTLSILLPVLATAQVWNEITKMADDCTIDALFGK
jgi:hypothetical protein